MSRLKIVKLETYAYFLQPYDDRQRGKSLSPSWPPIMNIRWLLIARYWIVSLAFRSMFTVSELRCTKFNTLILNDRGLCFLFAFVRNRLEECKLVSNSFSLLARRPAAVLLFMLLLTELGSSKQPVQRFRWIKKPKVWTPVDHHLHRKSVSIAVLTISLVWLLQNFDLPTLLRIALFGILSFMQFFQCGLATQRYILCFAAFH